MDNDIKPPVTNEGENGGAPAAGEPLAPPPVPETSLTPEENSDSADTATTPDPESTTPDTTPPAPAGGQQITTFQAKPRWGRRIVLGVVILALLGGAVWAAMRLNKPAAPAVSTAPARHDIALLRVGLRAEFQPSLYPKDKNFDYQIEVNDQVFEGLVQFQNETKLVPKLASSWSNPDNTTWVFKLRPDVRFHDGNLMTSKQVKASLDAAATTDYAQYASTIKSVTATDPTTVTIVTKAADPLLVNKLAHLYIYDTDSPKAGDAITGTGPYVVKTGTVPTKTGIDLIAWDKYYGGHAYTREIKYVGFDSDNAMAQAVKSGQLDFAVFNDQKIAKQAITTGWTSYAEPNLGINFLMLNTLKKGSPLANLKVRQAIYQAIDPQALLKLRNVENATPPTQLVPQEVPGYDPTIKRPAVDINAAKQLLAQAGYPKGFSATIVLNSAAQDVVAEISKELAQVGITLKTDTHSDTDSFFAAAFSGKPDLVYIGYATDLLDASDPISNLVVDTPNYQSKQLDALFQQSQTETNPAKRIKLLQQMEDLAMQDLPVLPMYQLPSFPAAVRSNLNLVTQNLNTDTGVYFWQVYAK